MASKSFLTAEEKQLVRDFRASNAQREAELTQLRQKHSFDALKNKTHIEAAIQALRDTTHVLLLEKNEAKMNCNNSGSTKKFKRLEVLEKRAEGLWELCWVVLMGLEAIHEIAVAGEKNAMTRGGASATMLAVIRLDDVRPGEIVSNVFKLMSYALETRAYHGDDDDEEEELHDDDSDEDDQEKMDQH